MDEIIAHLTYDNFDANVLKSPEPVLVEFWAGWCGESLQIVDLIDSEAEHYSGKVTFAKVNVDEVADIPSQYNITSIPTLLLFKDGAAVDTHNGLATRSMLRAFVDKNI
jgi:thioredoxin 1